MKKAVQFLISIPRRVSIDLFVSATNRVPLFGGMSVVTRVCLVTHCKSVGHACLQVNMLIFNSIKMRHVLVVMINLCIAFVFKLAI